jgi:hypothetical protein
MAESEAAIRAWEDYAAMPATGRSAETLLGQYAGMDDPPTRSLHTLRSWARRYSWQTRLAAHLAREREEADARVREARSHVFEHGLGLDYQRVTAWKRVAAKALAALEAADFGTHEIQTHRRDGTTRIDVLPNTPPRYIEVQAHLLEAALTHIREEVSGGLHSPDTLVLIQSVHQTARDAGLTPLEILEELSPELQARLRPALVLPEYALRDA